MKYSQKQPHTNKIWSKVAAQVFTVAAQNIHTLHEDSHNLSMIMKTSLMDGCIKSKALHILRLMLLFHRPVQVSYHRLCSGPSYAH